MTAYLPNTSPNYLDPAGGALSVAATVSPTQRYLQNLNAEIGGPERQNTLELDPNGRRVADSTPEDDVVADSAPHSPASASQVPDFSFRPSGSICSGAGISKRPTVTIIGARFTRGGEVSQQVLTRPGRFKQVVDNLLVKEVWVGDRERELKELKAELGTLSDQAKQGQSKRTQQLSVSRRYGRYPKWRNCLGRTGRSGRRPSRARKQSTA